MNFHIKEAIQILERTPQTLELFLTDLSDKWLTCNEGAGTWNVIEVIEHLIEGEKNNWIPRLQFIIEKGVEKPFPPFDRFSHLSGKERKSVEQLLLEFKKVRAKSLTILKDIHTKHLLLERKGIHPALGEVTAEQLLSTWVVHDLTHISQIVRIMAGRYQEDVGPWREYLRILS